MENKSSTLGCGADRFDPGEVKVPLFWPPAQSVDLMLAELGDSLRGRWWGEGPKVEKFEKRFGEKFGFDPDRCYIHREDVVNYSGSPQRVVLAILIVRIGAAYSNHHIANFAVTFLLERSKLSRMIGCHVPKLQILV